MLKKILIPVVLWGVCMGVFILSSCSVSNRTESTVSQHARQACRSLVIEASLQSLNDEHAEAVLALQEALRYDSAAGIFVLLAKEYAYLGKYALAVEISGNAILREPENIHYRLSRAEYALEEGDMERTLAEYEEIVRIAPRNYDARFSLAALIARSDPERSIAIYRELVSAGYERVASLLRIADLELRSQRHENAAHALEQIVALEPENLQAHERLAEIYHSAKNYDAERAQWDLIGERQGPSAALNLRRAESYRAQEQWSKAIDYYTMIIQDTSASPEISNTVIGIIASRARQDSSLREKAMAETRAFIKQKPKEAWPRYFLSELLLIGKPTAARVAEAKKEITKARQLSKGIPQITEAIASLLVSKELYPDAMEFLSAERDSFPTSENVYYFYGFAASQLGKTSEAHSALARALEINPRSLSSLVALAALYEREKDFARSGDMYEQALEIDSTNALVLNNYSYSLAERGVELERALSMAEKAVAREPNNGSFLDTYGWAFYKLGRYKEAAEWIEKAVLQRPNAVLYEHCGDAWYYAGDPERARTYWQKALDASPPSTTAAEKLAGGPVAK